MRTTESSQRQRRLLPSTPSKLVARSRAPKKPEISGYLQIVQGPVMFGTVQPCPRWGTLTLDWKQCANRLNPCWLYSLCEESGAGSYNLWAITVP